MLWCKIFAYDFTSHRACEILYLFTNLSQTSFYMEGVDKKGVERAAGVFCQQFGDVKITAAAAAPGRVNVIGE